MADTNMPTPAAAGNLIPFSFEGAEVRVIEHGGNPWFVLADVCRVLEVGNPSDAAKRLDSDEKMTLDNTEGHSGQRGGVQSFTIVNESGLYGLILTSRKPSAKRFKKWVTAEVLPSIRRTGRYAVPGRDDAPADMDLVPLDERRAAVAEVMLCMRLFGPGAARDLWKRSCLPAVEDALVDMSGVARKVMRDDGPACLAHLLAARTTMDATLGELVRRATADADVASALRRTGIQVSPKGWPGWIAVANSHDSLALIFQDTKWAGGLWRDALLVLAGARGTKQAIRFADGIRSRAVLRDPLKAALEIGWSCQCTTDRGRPRLTTEGAPQRRAYYCWDGT